MDDLPPDLASFLRELGMDNVPSVPPKRPQPPPKADPKDFKGVWYRDGVIPF